MISEDKDFDASKGGILEIIIEVPKKPRPRRRSDAQIPLITTRYHADARARVRHKQLERETCGLRPVKLSELPALGEPAARDGNLIAWIVRGS
jgi:hypothetical protein